MSLIDARLAALVHESAHGDPIERSRHERFIVARLAAGLIALAFLPPYLLLRGAPTTAEYLIITALVMPIGAAVLLSRTGRLATAHAISSAALAVLVSTVAILSGGIASAATIWLVAIPFEALLSGSRRAALAASAIAVLSILAIAVFGPAPGAETLGWHAAVAVPIFAVLAIAHAAAQALEFARFEGLRQNASRVREAQDRSLLQAIDDLVTWHDRNGHVVKASAAAMKLLGVPAGALQGRGLFLHVHVADRPAFLKAISDAAVSDRPVVVQFRLHGGDGSDAPPEARPRGVQGMGARVIWVEMRAHRVEAPAQENAEFAVVAVTRDVSEHKRHAEELEEARAEAERADALKGRFLATVSHELRTPLNAIIGFSEILATEHLVQGDTARCREYAGIIRDSGQHLLEVVNTLLDMSKIETGNFDFVPEPFDVGPLVHGCCDLMALKAEQAGILLARDIAPELPEFVSDRRACRQILINLLSNAVKFTPRGGRITVSARRQRDRIVFQVSDTGIGIAEEDLPRIGDPFFQAGAAAYDRPHEGTGLGLSVVRGLVGLHRGSLSIESAPGAGTAVTVTMPVDCRSGSARTESAKVETIARARELRAQLKTG